MTATKEAREPRTLTQFAKDQKRSVCPVCKLPPDAREQLRGAGEKKISRDMQILWVEKEYDIKVTVEDITRHSAERHDTP